MRSLKDEAGHFRSFLVRSLVTLVIPQGYTLSIAGSFALAVHRYGYPGEREVVLFVGGAVVAFIGLAIVAEEGFSGVIAALPMGLGALLNAVPLLVVLGVAGVVAVVPSILAGFGLAGLAGAGGYVIAISAFFWLVHRFELHALS